MDACRGCLLLLAAICTVLGGKDEGVFLNIEAFLPQNIRNTTIQLAKSVTVSCHSNLIKVYINRASVLGIGVISPSQVHLDHLDCEAKANRENFSLSTGFLECGTNVTFTTDQKKAIMTNKVVVTPPVMFMDYEEDEENPYDGSKAEISFTCTYDNQIPAVTISQTDSPSESSVGQLTTSFRGETTSVAGIPAALPPSDQDIQSADIRLYSTDSYINPIDVGSTEITRGTSLYVQITALDGEGESAQTLIDSCYLSSEPRVIADYEPFYLIRNGCEYDRDVQFKLDQPKTFIFRAKRVNGNKPSYLHCTLIPCTLSPNSECVEQTEYCENHAGLTELSAAQKTHVMLIEPITVIKRKPSIPKPTTKPAQPPSTVRTTPAVDTKDQSPFMSVTQGRYNILPVKSLPCNCQPITEDITVSHHSTTIPQVPTGTTIIVGIASFCIGAGLVGIMWGVYVKTDPRQKMHSVSMSSDDALSSQESTTPTEKLMGTSTEPSTSSYEV